MKCAKFQLILSSFSLEANLGLASVKYFIFDTKVEIDTFEISVMPNFNNFWDISTFWTNFGLKGGRYFINFIFHNLFNIFLFVYLI